MAIGRQITKAEIDATSASVALNIQNALARATDMKAWLDTKTEQDLVTLGYTSSEVAILKSAFTDLANLAAVYRGEREQVGQSDFRYFAKRLTGFGF